MSDMFGAPPAPPKRQRRHAGGAGQAQTGRPATERQVVQAEHKAAGGAGLPHAENLPDLPNCTESQTPQPLPRGTPRILHDGRQVDSWSEEWRLECLARTLLQLDASEREAWINGYGTAAAQVEVRLRIQSIKASRA